MRNVFLKNNRGGTRASCAPLPKSAPEGGGFQFLYLPLDDAVDTLSKKAMDVFSPDGTNEFGEKREQWSLRFTDSAENVVPPSKQINAYL